MGNLGNKEIFARNLKRYMDLSGKTQKEICRDLNFGESTFSEWVNANTYPRIDKIEMLANYFGIEKSDLIEENKDRKAFELKGTYFNFAKSLQEKNVSEDDLQKIWQFYEMIKNK
jgi:transcriptional regulator with XRE-family HTH domain